MLLMGPPERVLLEHLVLLEVLTDAPAFIICESEAILLEEGVNTGDTSVPRVLQIV